MTLLKSMWKSVVLMSIAGVLVFAGGALAQSIDFGSPSTPVANVTQNVTFSQTLTATGFTTVADIEWTVLPTLPAGLTLTGNGTVTGTVGGTPTAVTASATYTITAANTGNSGAGDETATKTLTFAVVAPPAQSIAFTTPSTPVGATVGQAYSQTMTASGFTTVADIEWTVSPALPAGLTLTGNGTVTGTVGGTPTAVTASATYTITAANTGNSGAGDETATKTLTFAVVAPPAQSIAFTTPSTPVGATVGQAYSQTMTASGFTTAADIVWSVSPALPAGLTLTGNGTVTGTVGGTPTAVTASATYTITATNSGNSGAGDETATKALTFAVTQTPAGTGSIAGKISGSDQAGTTGGLAATVTLLKDGNALASSITTTAATNGTYTLSGIPAGIYTVEASMGGYVTGVTGNITVGTTAITDRNLVLDKAYTITYTVAEASAGVPGGTITANQSDGTKVNSGTGVKENTTVTFEVTPASGRQVSEWKVGGVTVERGMKNRYTIVVGKSNVTIEAITVPVPVIAVTLLGLDTSKFQVNRQVTWVLKYELGAGKVWGDEDHIRWTPDSGKKSTPKVSPFKVATGGIPNGLTESVRKLSNKVVTDTISGTISDLVTGPHAFTLNAIQSVATTAEYIMDSAATNTLNTTSYNPEPVAGFPATGITVKAKTVIAPSNIVIDNAAKTYKIGEYQKVAPSIGTSFGSVLSADGGTAVFHVTYKIGETIISTANLPADSNVTANYGVLNAGTYSVTVRAFNRYYDGTKTTTFTVNPRDISVTSNNITPTATTAGALTYDGTDQSKNISVKVQDGQTVLVEGVDWEGRYTGAAAIKPGITNAGVSEVQVKGIGNYTGIRNTTFSVNKLRIYVDTNTMATYARPYNGTTTFDTVPSTGTATAYQLAPAILFSEAANTPVAVTGTSTGTPSGSAVLNHRTQYVVTAGNFVNATGTATADSATATRVKLTVKLLDSLNYTLSGTATATNGGSVDFFKKAVINRAVPDTSHFKFSIPETLVHGYTGKARGIGDVTLKTTLGGMGKFRVLYGADTAKPVIAGSYPVSVVVDSLGANFRTGTVALGTYTISAPGVPVIDDIAWQTGITVREGVALALTVPATAPTTGGTLSYQWFRDDVAVANNGRAATLNVNGLINGNTYNFKVIVTNTKSAGAAGSEVGSVERVVAVNVIDPPINLSTATFSVKGAYVYTGSPIEPPTDSIVVTVPAKEVGGEPVTLVRGTDYTVSFARNTNVGNATVSITGVDEYIGLRTTTFQIRAKTPDANDLTFRGRTVYNGKTQAITVSPIAGTGLGAVTVKYDGSTTAPKDAGMYVVTADFAAGTNFTAATNVSLGFYTISPLTLTADSLIFKRWPNQILVDSVAKYAIGDVFVRVDSTKLTVLYAGDEEVPTTIGSYPVTVLVEDENFVTGLIPLGEFNVVDSVVSVKSGNRVIPGTGAKEVAAVAPVKAATAVFTAGPSPVSKNGTIKFFSAKQVTSGSLYIFDATGKSVAKVGVKAGTGVIGSWSANAAEGSYIVKGVLAGKDGTREKVSFVFSVVK